MLQVPDNTTQEDEHLVFQFLELPREQQRLVLLNLLDYCYSDDLFGDLEGILGEVQA